MDSKLLAALVIAHGRAVQRLLRPARSAAKLMIGAAGDLTRTRSAIVAENALLRQQLIVLRRSIERPRLHHDERVLLLARARLTRRWRRLCAWSAPRCCCPGIVWCAERIQDKHQWAAWAPIIRVGAHVDGKGSQHGLSIPPMRNNSLSNELSPWVM